MLPHTHAWSRTQKALIIAASFVAPIALVTLIYIYERDHPLPDASILVGTWEMTAPNGANSSTFLRLDPEQTAAWHRGAWVRNDSSEQQGYSEMMCGTQAVSTFICTSPTARRRFGRSLRYFPTSFGLDMLRQTIFSSAGEMPAYNQTMQANRRTVDGFTFED